MNVPEYISRPLKISSAPEGTIMRHPIRCVSAFGAVLLQTVVALSTGMSVLSTYASAAPITEWAFTIENGFTAFAPTGVTGMNDNAFLTSLPAGGIPAQGGGTIGPFASAPTLLQWGVPDTSAGQSSLSAGSPTGTFMGTLMTDGPAVTTVQVVHANNPVFEPFLMSATLSGVLSLTPIMPPGPGFLVPALQFDILFEETLNEEPCVALGSPPCSDIFVVDVAGAGFNPIDNSFSAVFLGPMGIPYEAKILVTGLMTLSDDECMLAGASIGCQGFITLENDTSVFQASLQINSVRIPVPEPGTLALFGLGLAGLGFARRRKLAKHAD